MRLQTLQIEIANPDASDPRSIVTEAIQKKSANQKEDAWTKYDSAWAVFDGDEHIQNDPNNWNDALQRADAHGIDLAVSNPSFELWLLLHYQDQYANLHRAQVIRELKRHLSQYAKGAILYPDPLESRTAEAAARAQALAERIRRDGLDQYTNPSTGIGDLVIKLMELKSG